MSAAAAWARRAIAMGRPAGIARLVRPCSLRPDEQPAEAGKLLGCNIAPSKAFGSRPRRRSKKERLHACVAWARGCGRHYAGFTGAIAKFQHVNLRRVECRSLGHNDAR